MSAHELQRIAAKVYNTPHLMTHQSFDFAINYLEQRNSGSFEMAVVESKADKRQRELNYNPDTGIGIIPIEGALTYLEYQGMCGEEGTSYQGIKAQARQMLKAGAHTIVMWADSGGGEAYQMFETGDWLRAEADKYGARILTYVDGIAASAAYGLSAISDEIIVNPMAEVGSIGVVVKLRNYSEAMKKAGVSDTYVYAGKNKIPFDANGEFSQEFLDGVQVKVGELYNVFTQYVATHRKISLDVVKATEAGMFSADKAIELGLADKKMTLQEFNDYLATIVENGGKKPTNKLEKLNMSDEEKMNLEEVMKQKDELSAQVTALQSTMQELTSNYSAMQAKYEAAVERIAQMEAQAKEQKTQMRKAAIAEFEKDEAKATNYLTSMEALDDAAFSLIVGGMKAAAEVVEKGDMYQELGSNSQAAADAQREKVDTSEDSFTRKMKAKYQQ